MRRRRGKTLSKRGLDGVSLLGNGTRIVLTQGDSAGQLIYTMPLMVGSQELPVQVDTGSSDLVSCLPLVSSRKGGSRRVTKGCHHFETSTGGGKRDTHHMWLSGVYALHPQIENGRR